MAEKEPVPNFIPTEEDSRQAREHIKRIRRSLNLLLGLGTLIFIGGVVASVMSFLFLQSANKELANKKELLAVENQKANEAQIAELNRFDTRLRSAKELLSNHRVISPVLREIEDHILEVIQIENASITTDDSGRIMVTGKGEALNYQSLATQSDAFSDSDYISDPIFTSFEENEDGLVSFQYSINVDQRLTQSVFSNTDTLDQPNADEITPQEANNEIGI